MKKVITMLLALLVTVFMSGAFAVPPGMTVEYTKSPMGKVVFDGKSHADKALMCDACHPKVFEQKKGTAKISLAAHQEGKFCFTCHNDSTAFKSDGNCNRCHKQ